MSKTTGACLAVLMALGTASAQAGTAPAAGSKASRPTIAVMNFDFGTVNDHWWGNADIGKGVADQLMDSLLEDGTFRVIERKKLDTVLAEQDFARSDRADPSAAKLAKVGKVLGVKYIMTGSITKFGSENKQQGAKIKGIGLGMGKLKTEVGLTARIVDATTGEVLISAKGVGVSTKKAIGGSVKGMEYSESKVIDKSQPIGEAQEKACAEVVKALIAKKDRLN